MPHHLQKCAASSAPQVHEASLQWQLGLLSSTAFRTGAALVPFQPRILDIIAALADAPSQAGPAA